MRPVPANIEEEIAAIEGIHTLDEGTMLEEASLHTSDPTAAWLAEPPGADTAGLDAAPKEIPTRVGAGLAGDMTGLPEEEIEAADADGSDGSDIDIEDSEVDPEHPKDLKDLLGEAAEEEHEVNSARPPTM